MRVSFTDRFSFDLDLRRWFTEPSGELLGSPEDFKRVRLHRESDTLLWDNDYHVHGEELYEHHQEGARP